MEDPEEIEDVQEMLRRLRDGDAGAGDWLLAQIRKAKSRVRNIRETEGSSTNSVAKRVLDADRKEKLQDIQTLPSFIRYLETTYRNRQIDLWRKSVMPGGRSSADDETSTDSEAERHRANGRVLRREVHEPEIASAPDVPDDPEDIATRREIMQMFSATLKEEANRAETELKREESKTDLRRLVSLRIASALPQAHEYHIMGQTWKEIADQLQLESDSLRIAYTRVLDQFAERIRKE